jgi:hypothetical protein
MAAGCVTARALNRATLERQLLTRRADVDPVQATRQVLALQAQHPASPYLALWARVEGLTPEAVDSAFDGYRLVRATLLRMTLQAVAGTDHALLRTAIEPTMYTTHIDGRFTPPGLDPGTAAEVLAELLAFAAGPRTAGELTEWLGERISTVPRAGVWAVARSYTPFVRVPTGGPWSFGARASFVAPEPVPRLDAGAAHEALQEYVRRYLAAYGPSTAADIAGFALVPQVRVKRALRALGDAVRPLQGPGKGPLHDLADATVPDGSHPVPPRLLPMWDNVLLAHAGRDRLLPPQYRKLVVRSNGDVLPTVLVDGLVAGVWRAVCDGDGRGGGIEVTAFEPLPAPVWDALAAEAGALAAFLAARQPRPYARHDRWWATLPAAQTRVLAAA